MEQNEWHSLFQAPTVTDYAALMLRTHALADRFSFLRFQYLGNSILGRGIPLLILGEGERKILYVGAHHGMEWITSLLLLRFTKELCEDVETNRSEGAVLPSLLLRQFTFLILPMLNPDGVEYQIHGPDPDHPLYERLLTMNGGSTDFSHWQANARGVDLNHNYDADFEKYKALEAENAIFGGAPTRYSGEYPESEPETAALCNLIRYQTPLAGVMSLHTQGEEIFFPDMGKNHRRTAAIARHLSASTGYRLSRAEGLGAFGGLSDWCAGALGIPSFTLECGLGKNPLPISQFSRMYCKLRRALFLFPTFL